MKSKNWKSLAFVVGTVVMFVCVSCAQDPEQSSVEQQTAVNPVGSAITVGNHSWIPLDWSSWSEGRISISLSSRILNIVNDFESAKPWLETTDWRLEIRHKGYACGQYIYGIWVDHRVKPGYVEEYQVGGYPTGRYIKQEER